MSQGLALITPYSDPSPCAPRKVWAQWTVDNQAEGVVFTLGGASEGKVTVENWAMRLYLELSLTEFR